MRTQTKLFTWLGLLLTVISIAAPLIQNADQLSRGDIPEKFVDTTIYGLLNPLSDLKPFVEEGTKVELRIGDETYQTFSIQQFQFSNKGKAPIAPSDFVEPLRVTAQGDWKIVSLRDSSFSGTVNLEWTRLSEKLYQAKPFLLNPGESVWQTVYLSRADNDAGLAIDTQPAIKLSMRVINLVNSPSHLGREDLPDVATPLVFLTFWAAVFVVILAGLLIAWYAWANKRLGNLSAPTWKVVLLTVAFASLSYATAEVVAFYIFPGDFALRMLYGNQFLNWKAQWHNWLILITNFGVMYSMYRRVDRLGR